MVVAVEQAQSYLASINALTMLKHENAWFAHAAGPEVSQSADGAESLFEQHHRYVPVPLQVSRRAA